MVSLEFPPRVGHGTHSAERRSGSPSRVPTGYLRHLEAPQPSLAARGTALLGIALSASRKSRWGGTDVCQTSSCHGGESRQSMPGMLEHQL